MKRLRRRAVNVLTAISPFIFVASVSLWAISYYRLGYISHNSPGRVDPHRGIEIDLAALSGQFILARENSYVDPPDLGWHRHLLTLGESVGHYSHLVRYRWNLLGFSYADCEFGSILTIPIWMILAFATVLPAAQLIAWRRRKKLVDTNHCVTCGYDLRATPERCPECGTVPEKRVIAPK
jgi:hypothetical protein